MQATTFTLNDFLQCFDRKCIQSVKKISQEQSLKGFFGTPSDGGSGLTEVFSGKIGRLNSSMVVMVDSRSSCISSGSRSSDSNLAQYSRHFKGNSK